NTGPWLIRTLAVGGGLLLVAAAAMAVVREPIRKRTIGSWAVRVSLLVPLLTLAPAWLNIQIAEPASEPAPKVVAEAPPSPTPAAPKLNPDCRPTTTGAAGGVPTLLPNECYIVLVPPPAVLPAVPESKTVSALQPAPAPVQPATPEPEARPSQPMPLLGLLGVAYLLVAGVF